MDQNQRISQLEELVSEILLKIDRLSQDIATQRTAQLQLMKTVLRQSDSIEYLIVQQTALREDSATLRGEFTSLRGEFAEVREDFTTLRQEFAELRQDQHALRGDFATLRGEVAALRQEFAEDKAAKDVVLENIMGALRQLLDRK